MSYFEREREEAEKRRIRYTLQRQEEAIATLTRERNDQEEYDDSALWEEIDGLKQEIRELRLLVEALKR